MIKGHDGTWYLATRTRKVTSKEEYLVFLSGEKGGKNATEVTEKDLCDTTGKGRLLYKEIIFGCVGGVFHATDGVRSARVTECVASEEGDSIAKIRFVHWRSAADNEVDAGVTSSGTADQFFSRFPPAPLGAVATGGGDAGGGGAVGAGAVGEIPLDEYPHLAKLLKATLWRSGAAQAHLEGARLGAFILMATRGATPSPTAEQVPRLAAAAEGVLKAAAEGDPAAFAAVLLELADEFSYGDTESSASAAGLAVADSIVGLIEDLGGAVAAALAPAAPKRKKAPATAAGAAQKRARAEPDSLSDVLAESDDGSEDSYDEEDGEVEEPAQVTPAKRKRVTIAGVTDAEAASGAESERPSRRFSSRRSLSTASLSTWRSPSCSSSAPAST